MLRSSSPSSDVVFVSRSRRPYLYNSSNRHLVYVFIGCLLLGGMVINNIAGGIVGVIGLAYVVLEFVPQIEPPSNMREADVAGWGAEQV